MTPNPPIIVLDTETTGLMLPGLARLDDQPHLIEIAAAKLDVGGEWHESFHCLVKPPVPIPSEITKITGITQQAANAGVPVAEALDRFAEFCLGERVWIAHNLAFDRDVLATELRRLKREYRFPWPTQHVCTVEHTKDLGLPDRKLTTLYEYLFGAKLKQEHRAMADVEALVTVVTELWKRGILTL